MVRTLVMLIASAGALLVPAMARSGGGPIVALFDMEDKGSGMKPMVLSNLIDYLAARLTECGYQVVPQDQIRERIKKQQLASKKECFDQSCQIELGRELAAQKTLSTKILRIGDSCQVTAIMFDLKRAATENAATAGSPCEVNQLLIAVNQISSKLCMSIKEAQRKADEGLAEFEKIRKSIQQEKAELVRMEKAWKIVSQIANDDKVRRETRVMAVQKFLSEFQLESSALKEARRVLAEIHLATLSVRTVPPGAEVVIAGEPAGKSPLTRELKAGNYELIARLEGYREGHVLRRLEPGEKAEVVLRLAVVPPGRLTVRTTPPGAQLTIDGTPAGKAPVSRELKPGDYELSATLVGYKPTSEKLRIEQGKQHAVTLKLEQAETGKLQVATDPPGARVSIDGQVAGVSPLTRDLKGGPHQLSAHMDGYDPLDQTATVALGRTTELSLKLVKEKPLHLYNVLGHLGFWGGVGLVAFGGASMGMSIKAASDYDDGDPAAADTSKSWEGAMWTGYCGGAALMIGGLVFWLLEPDEAESTDESTASFGPTPDGQGMVFSLGGRW